MRISLFLAAAFAQPSLAAVRWEILNGRARRYFPLSNSTASQNDNDNNPATVRSDNAVSTRASEPERVSNVQNGCPSCTPTDWTTGSHGPILYPNGTLPPSPPVTTCIEPKYDVPITVYSIVYTSTVTFYGNQTGYTAPYPTIETPIYCGDHGPPVTESFSKVAGHSSKPTAVLSASEPRLPPDYGQSSYSGEMPPLLPTMSRVTVTFITTDKNPSVAFPSEPVPRYSQPANQPGGGGGRISAYVHHTVARDHPTTEGAPGGATGPQSAQQGPSGSTYAITARAPQVIINKQTYSDLKPGQTKTVIVDHGTFTIYPSAVIGEGETISKPEPMQTTVSVLTPTSAMVGGFPVVVSGSEAVIGGTRIEIPPAGTTAKVQGEQVSVMPGKVIIDGESLTFQASGARQTDVVVTGGEMVTAIGQSIYVFHSTTLTYGSDIRETTEVIDDDTVTIGPSGIVIQGTTMGGPSAETSETSYEIVGGATITKMSPSLVIIKGSTYTVGPSAKSTSTVIGGETVTFGSEGVIVETMTLSYPFGSSVVTTIGHSATKDDDLPLETGTKKTSGGRNGNDNDNGDGDEEDSGGNDKADAKDDSSSHLLQPSIVAGMTGLCIAMGVWILF